MIMKHTREALCQNQEFFAYEKGFGASYSFYGVLPLDNKCRFVEYTIAYKKLEISSFILSKSEAIDILKRCQHIDKTYLKLFESIYSHIGYTVIALTNLILLDKEFIELDFSDVMKLEFYVSSYTPYDSYRVSESRITFSKRDDFVFIEKNSYDGCPVECVPDYPFYGEVNIRVKGMSFDKRYATPISEKTYNIFDTTLVDGIGVWMELCKSIDRSYTNISKSKNG